MNGDIVLMEKAKACTRCGVEKPLSEFNKHSITKDGLDHQCRLCANERSKAFRSTPSGIYTSLKGNQTFLKRKPITITRKEFITWHDEQTKQCVYCDILEEDIHLMSDYYRAESRLTVDCMANDVGYVLGNIVLACGRCNFLKSNLLSYDEMRH